MLVPLVSGAYEARDLISSAQKEMNLFPEANPQGANPMPVTHYPTPGLRVLGTLQKPSRGRGLYTDITGTLWAMTEHVLYKVNGDFTFTEIADTNVLGYTTPVSMADNEVSVMMVDGSSTGWSWDVGSGANFTQITDVNFFGSTRVDYLNTFFLLNRPNTPQFYASLSGQITFNPLYFANLTGTSTDLVAAAALHGIVWLIGKTGTEIWFNAVDPNLPGLLPFQRMPDQVLHQGCAAPYSIARIAGGDDTQTVLMWLSQTKDGHINILAAQGYTAKRVSTHAIEYDIAKYPRIDDAVAWAYQQEGHSFYVLNFPTADVTWCYDATIGLWHQRSFLDTETGQQHRHRGQSATFAYGQVVVQDWEDGTLYALDLDTYVDQRPSGDTTIDVPITRTRSFPHLVNGLNRVIYSRFVLDMDPGNLDDSEENPQVSLRWSDDRGHSYSNAVMQSLGQTGQFDTNLLWTRLGMARDRVFEVSWSVDAKTALNGAYVEPIPLAT